MLDKNSFRTIRTFNGSQQGGFEELVCQLAHLAVPTDAQSFVRKEGAGGDAGVECFWILKDGSEHAWQAKFFVDDISPARWTQINESVETALKKHPKLRKYYVCVPADRTDTRATGRRAGKSVSVLDKWNEAVKKWIAFASNLGMNVEFEFWGAHEILLPLQSDGPKYAGRALYWFNSIVLTNEKLKGCIEKQERTLGERYTPEFHVDLPIAKTLDGLVNGDSFWHEINQSVLKWNKEQAAFFRNKPPGDLTERFLQTKRRIEECKRVLDSVILARDRSRLNDLRFASDSVNQILSDLAEACRASEDATKRPNQHTRSFQDEVYDFTYRKHAELSSLLSSDFISANIAKAILVTGDAGSGKSHLLCDFAKRFVQSGNPAILLLGQHYRGGNPLAELLDLLDLNGRSYESVLGAIDAAGEAARVNSIVLVDAINEGGHRDEWSERFVGFLDDVTRFPHISLVISCRTRFDALLVPSTIEKAKLLRVSHEGFRGHEHKAASIYLSGQGIAKPSTPISSPEFSNPLFLKTCANALKQLGETSWPKGYQGASSLFDIYLSSLEVVVGKRRRTEANDKLCQKALEAVANAMIPEHLFGLPWDEARDLVNAIDTCVNPSESLLQTLLNEGALADDIEYIRDVDGGHTTRRIVRFAYERFCDQFVAQKLLQGVEDPADVFKGNQPIGKAIGENKHFRFEGILRALSIIIPEKHGVEFWDLLPNKLKSHPQAADNFFFDALPYRAPTSFTPKTVALFNSLRPFEHGFANRRHDLMIQFATEPTHPWNAEKLHARLSSQVMPKRDAWWSVYVAKNDFQEEEGESESPIRSIIEWATTGDLTFVEEERVFLALIALIWFTTTTNRKTRDQATKAAVRLLAKYPNLVERLLMQFRNVDDLYLQERLYASAYGGLCNATNDDSLKSVATLVFEIFFKENQPVAHLLLRDYARGIVELASSRNCIDESIVLEGCRPPYKSTWPLENPHDSRFNPYGRKIEYSIFSDDFGTYTLSTVEKWSPTALSEHAPQSQSEVLESLVALLSDASKELFYKAIELEKLHEEQRWKNTMRDYQQSRLDEDDDLSFEDILKSNAELPDDSSTVRVFEDAAGTFSMPPGTDDQKATQEDPDSAWKRFNETLDDATREQFRDAQGYWRNGRILASFSRDWAKNWVCKHSFELGWTEELFGDFEKSLPYDGRDRPRIERIGKKYQRIAFYKFLAHLADNVHYKDDAGYSDTPKPSRYRGPWQLWKRDIDPTHWMRKTSESEWGEWGANIWWRPIEYKFHLASDESKRAWCEESGDLPAFSQLIKPVDSSKNNWYALRGYSSWREKQISGHVSSLRREIWFRINSIVVKKKHFARLKKEVKNKDFISPDFVSSPSTGHQIFMREYPWHPSATMQDQFDVDEAWEIKTPHMVPYAEYEWERGSGDQSAEMNLNLNMPSSFVIKHLDLEFDRNSFNRWTNEFGQTAFFDPSLEFDGPSFGLFDCNSIDSMLSMNEWVLVWLIGGEKMILDEAQSMVAARMVYNSMLWTTGDGKIHNDDRHYME